MSEQDALEWQWRDRWRAHHEILWTAARPLDGYDDSNVWWKSNATSSNGNLNALMTTIAEGATVDEGHLIPALKGQCKSVTTNVNVNPQGPGNLPGT